MSASQPPRSSSSPGTSRTPRDASDSRRVGSGSGQDAARTRDGLPDVRLLPVKVVNGELVAGLPEAILDVLAARVLDELDGRAQAASQSRWMTVRSAAVFLDCGEQRIRNLLTEGRLTRHREGGRTLVARAEVEALVVSARYAHRGEAPSHAASGTACGQGVPNTTAEGRA